MFLTIKCPVIQFNSNTNSRNKSRHRLKVQSKKLVLTYTPDANRCLGSQPQFRPADYTTQEVLWLPDPTSGSVTSRTVYRTLSSGKYPTLDHSFLIKGTVRTRYVEVISLCAMRVVQQNFAVLFGWVCPSPSTSVSEALWISLFKSFIAYPQLVWLSR